MGLSRARRLAKEGSWVIAGQIASVAGALVLVRVLTEYLEPAQYGQLALGLTIAGLVNQFVMGGVTNGIGRFYSIAAEKNDLPGYLHASCRLMGYTTAAVVTTALVLMVGLLWLGYSQWMGLAAAALVFSVLSGYNTLFSGIQNAARQRAIVAFHGGLNAWLKILLAAGVMLWLGRSSTAVVMGYALASLLVTGSQLFFLLRLIPTQSTRLREHDNWGQQIWAFSWPIHIWGFFTWLHLSSDRWALQSFASIDEVGLYAVLFQLGYSPIVLLVSMVTSFLGPIFYQRAGDATNPSRNANVTNIAVALALASVVVSVLAFIILTIFHGPVFKVFVTAEYGAISHLLPWMVLAGGVFGAGQVISVNIAALKKSKERIPVKSISAILGVMFNIIGAYIYGVEGVVYAMFAFSTVYFIWMLLLLRKLYWNEALILDSFPRPIGGDEVGG
jgi:O-antigen/teichoic acid export membrane protein